MNTEDYVYRVVGVDLPHSIERGETAKVSIRFKNVGKKGWYDYGKKRLMPEDTAAVGLIFNDEIQRRDFKFQPGSEEGKTDLKFHKTYESDGKTEAKNQHTCRVGQVVEIQGFLTAKKFATKGKHRLNIKLGYLEEKKIFQQEGAARISVSVPSDSMWLFHIKRALRLIFSRPGKIENTTSNKAFDSIPEMRGYTPIVMATWRRIENLPETIASLENQKGSKPILHIWNNNPEIREDIDSLIVSTKLPVYVHHSAHNIGGYGRFYAAKLLQRQFDRVIFIDDDQAPQPNDIKSYNDEFDPKVPRSSWAHKFEDTENYWHKRTLEPNEKADYLGTGGMVVATNVFLNKKVFKCPKLYWFVEDLWLSFVMDSDMGLELRQSNVTLEQKEDGKNQMSGLIDIKTAMLRYLVNTKRWRIQSDAGK